MSTIFLASVVAFAVCLSLMPVAIYLAPRLGLVDEPSERKRHLTPTPLVGGIVIFASLCISNFIFEQISWSFLGWMSLVLLIGVLDDIFDVSYRIRLGVHAAIVLGVFLTDGLLITNIGNIFWDYPVVEFFGVVAILFTAMGVIGAINSVNMIDGVDGLLSSIIIASLVVVAVFGFEARNADALVSVAMLIGAIGAFAVINCRFFGLRKALVFMGDSGSTMLGFFLVYALIAFSQEPSRVFSPVLAGWILGLPLLDASAVIATRVLDGKAPFHPDRRHLHHLLMDSGISVNRIVIFLLCCHLTLMVFASAMYLAFGNAADPYLFWGFVALVLLRAAYGKVHFRTEAENKSPDDSSQVITSQAGNAVAVGLGLPESGDRKNSSVGVANSRAVGERSGAG